MPRLAGKVAVITGGGNGIGLAAAQRFVDEGAHVFIVGRRQSELNKAKALIGDGVSTVAGDVTVSADLDRLFATVLEQKGALDVLVVGSGRVEPEELGKITEQNFDATFDLNARASLFTVQKALPLMRTGASVILVGSVADSLGVPGNSTYSATRAALRSYVRTWTREFTDRGIRFNTLSPGPIDTPMIDSTADPDATRAQFVAAIPLNRMGRPEEIAAAALFLAPMRPASCRRRTQRRRRHGTSLKTRPGLSTSVHPVAEWLWRQLINRAETAARSHEPKEPQNEPILRCV